jgi:hypothetical protein
LLAAINEIHTAGAARDHEVFLFFPFLLYWQELTKYTLPLQEVNLFWAVLSPIFSNAVNGQSVGDVGVYGRIFFSRSLLLL